MDTSTLPILALTDRIATYINAKFWTVVKKQHIHVPFPKGWDIELLKDCDLAAHVLAEAFKHRISTSWDVNEYAASLSPKNNGRNWATEERLKAIFPPIYGKTKIVDRPLMITDINGNVLTWYLPGILTLLRQATMWASLKELQPQLKITKSSTNWRVSSKYYRTSPSHTLKPGTASMSPAWFEQGHDTERYSLKVSKLLVAREGSARRWLMQMILSSALIGGILSVVQPDLYKAGRDAIVFLQEHTEQVDYPVRLHEVLQLWTAPFHGLSVISNRITPVHRDTNGGKRWMDILVTLGTYKQGHLELPGLGLRFYYDPGTVVAIAGRVIAHSALCNGDRACIAYYMREKVHNRLGLAKPDWYKPPKI